MRGSLSLPFFLPRCSRYAAHPSPHGLCGITKPHGVRRLGGLTMSVAQGPSEPPLFPHTIPEHFAEIVSRYGDRPAVIARSATPGRDVFITGRTPEAVETTLTYEDLDLSSNGLAGSLRSLGVKKGDRVAVSLGNCPEFAALTYGIYKLGAVLVPLNPNFNAEQVAAALSHLGVKLLIIGAVTDLAYKPCRGRSNLDLLRELVPDLESGRVESPSVPSLETVVVVDNSASHPEVDFRPESMSSLTPFSSLRDQSVSTVRPDAPLSAADTINVQFTSGTTSQPKAAMLSHTNILNNGHLIASRMGIGHADRVVCPPPLFHCFGSVGGYLATATTGAALLFPSPAFDPLATLRAVADHRATALYGVATMFVAMLETAAAAEREQQVCQQGGEPLLIDPAAVARFPEHLRTGIAAGSSVPETLMKKLYGRFGLADLTICYGMTETGPVSCMTAPADSFEKKTATVGRALPHTRIKVVDRADRSKIVPVGQRGEFATAGYLTMQGYWGDEKRTRETMVREPDGSGASTVWVYSGDEATMDADGYVEITGRIKDLIIRGGENIHPLEIEDCLFQHPLVAEASVVGVPDERYGESVAVFVATHQGVGGGGSALTKQDVRDWVRTRLSGHLVPKHVFWVDEYPKTASGKIQKFKLREMAETWIREAGEINS